MSEHICSVPPNDREAHMVVVRRNASGAPTVWCDPCIAPLVKALNDAGIGTVWSCCGHGFRPGMIGLADGRQLVIAPDIVTARDIMGGLFPVDINGQTTPHPDAVPSEPVRGGE